MDPIVGEIAALSDRDAMEAVKNLLILYNASGVIELDTSEEVLSRLLTEANMEEDLFRRLMDGTAEGNGDLARSALYIASFDQGRRKLLKRAIVLAKGAGRAEPLSLLLIVGLIYIASRLIPEEVVIRSVTEKDRILSKEIQVKFPKQSLDGLVKLFKGLSDLQG